MSIISRHPFTADSQADEAAGILLKEVEHFLQKGQPRQAAAHIVEMTGVERPLAEEFIAELKNRIFEAD